MSAEQLRDSWQGRVLAAARGRMSVVVASILAEKYDAVIELLFRVIRPVCWDDSKKAPKLPMLATHGKINHRGNIVADVVWSWDRAPAKNVPVFASERDFEYALRKLSDELKLSDAERQEFFAAAIKGWLRADMRLDPMMDPRDPDAKRIVH